jgi:hypothetical protein
MTETLPSVSSMPKEAKKTRRVSRSETERAAVRELVKAARARGEDLTGPDGLLKVLTKDVLEIALEEEMTEHLGYDKHAAEGRNNANSRNGTRAKTVTTPAAGEVVIEVPRDRDGTFEPVIVKKRQRRLNDVDAVVLSLFARGLTTGEISAHFAWGYLPLAGAVYGVSISKDTISRITDKVIEWGRPRVRGRCRRGHPGRCRPSTPRSSSMPSWSRSAMARSPTGRSMSRSGST